MIIGLILLSVISFGKGPDCFELKEAVEVVGNLENNSETHIEFSEEIFAIDETYYTIKERTRSYFSGRAELIRFFNCGYTFTEYNSSQVGYVDHLILLDGEGSIEPIFIINVYQGQKIDFIINEDRWITQNCNNFTFEEEALVSEKLETTDTSFVFNYGDDTTAYIYHPSSLTEVTEFVLVKDASIELELIEAKFEDVTEVVLSTESNLCKDIFTDYEYVTEQVLNKDGFTSLTVVPSIFDTVTEQVLKSEAYFEYEIKQPTYIFDSIKINKSPQVISLNKTWKEGCDSLSLDCIAYSFDITPSIDTTLLRKNYSCPEGYYFDGGLCLKQVEYPAVYEERTYQKLITPATTLPSGMQATYSTLTYIRIMNKNEIPDSCLEVIYKERTYQKLVANTQAILSEVPAEYKTRNYQKFVKDPNIEVLIQDSLIYHYEKISVVQNAGFDQIQSISPMFFSPGLLSIIANKLDTLGYDQDNVYHKLFAYLCDQDFPIFGLSEDFLDELDVSLDGGLDDNQVGNIEPKSYELLISQEDFGPILFVQNVLKNSCSEDDVISCSSLDLFLNGDFFNVRNSDGIISNIRQSSDGSKIEHLKFDPFTEFHTIVDFDLELCDERFPITHLGPDTIWLDIKDVFVNERGKKVIEFDIQLAQCINEQSQMFFQFIEGVGTNAGINYTIKDGMVEGFLLCHSNPFGTLYRAPGVSEGCDLISNSIENFDDLYTIYPNPVDNFLNVPTQFTNATIINSIGKTTKLSISQGVIDVSSFPTGFYGLILQNDSGDHVNSNFIVFH